MRALFNRQLFNVEGKIRMDRTNYPGLLGQVRKGVRQVFTRIACNDPVEELDIRFKYFTDTVSRMPVYSRDMRSRQFECLDSTRSFEVGC